MAEPKSPRVAGRRQGTGSISLPTAPRVRDLPSPQCSLELSAQLPQRRLPWILCSAQVLSTLDKLTSGVSVSLPACQWLRG